MNRLLSLSLLVLLILTYQVIFVNKFVPGVFIGDTNLTFQTKPQAQRLLQARFNQRVGQVLEFKSNEKTFSVNLSTASASANFTTAINEAFKIGHNGPGANRLGEQLQVILKPKIIKPEVKLFIEPQIELVASVVNKPSKNAALSMTGEITEEVVGSELDRETLLSKVLDYIYFGKTSDSLPIREVLPEVTTAKVLTAKAYVEEVKQKPIQLLFEGSSWIIDSKTLLTLLDLTKPESLVDKSKVEKYLKSVSDKVNQPLKEAQFNFNSTSGRVSAFQPAQEGRELDIEKTTTFIQLALGGERSKTITLPVKTIEPKIKTSEVNDLGIKELLGRGISHFAGSIPNRIYNVGLTATRINGVLIPPNSTFSFNNTVGDITEATGFKKAYVIKEGRTVLDDGGGVCQDSTTLFRAVLNAGLPVVKRTAHAYRVGYYEQGFPPGLDATVFYPSVDFQFKNDTGRHILVQAAVTGTTLTIDLYGSSDGRESSLTTSVITDQTPAPAELRQDDPTLPKGVVKQVDWAAAGAKVSFQRTVKRGEETLINETWKSNYKPWQAIYLVGTGG